jgi:hypothetical protein
MSHKHPSNFQYRHPLTPDVNGYCSEKYVRHFAEEILRSSKLNGYVPSDGFKFGINRGYPEEWAEFIIGQIKSKSQFLASKEVIIKKFIGKIDFDMKLIGLLYVNPLLVAETANQLKDPLTNLKAGINLFSRFTLLFGTIERASFFFDSNTPLDIKDITLPFTGRTIIGTAITTEAGVMITTDDGTVVVLE